MLPRHPDSYSDDELTVWIQHLVDDEVEEGKSLDYKELRGLDSNDYPEIAKDVSSFANEIGGTILYGIPEKRTADGRPIPDKPYGVDRIPSFESRVENVIVDAIKPTLPDYRIKEIPISANPKKVVYLVWVSQSWIGVHMVQAYNDQRYYHRGQYRAVPMTEEEVRQRYERILAASTWVDSFLAGPEMSYLRDRLPGPFRSNYVLCPLLPQHVDFVRREARDWLRAHQYISGHFYPSPYGVRTKLQIHGGEWQPVAEIHSNGAISHWNQANVDPTGEGDEFTLAHGVEFGVLHRFLMYASELYRFMGYMGPLRARIEIKGTQAPYTFILPHGQFESDYPKLLSADNSLKVVDDVSAATLVTEPLAIYKSLVQRVYQAFGIWEGPDESYLF